MNNVSKNAHQNTPPAMTAAASLNFWDWSLTRYARNGVEPVLLELQDDFGFNINIALWCCWCAENYETMPELLIRKAIDMTGQWSGQVTIPLRFIRRHLKARDLESNPDIKSLRQQIKEAELNAEKLEQSVLQQLAENELSKNCAPSDMFAQARRNLASYTMLIGAAQTKGFTTSLLETLISRIFDSVKKGDEQS